MSHTNRNKHDKINLMNFTSVCEKIPIRTGSSFLSFLSVVFLNDSGE